MERCAGCGTELPASAKFCFECGTPQRVEVTAAEERKIVTVLFCDLVGFTARSDLADPEDIRARIRPYHLRLRQEIERYGGTVEKFIGDAVMAVFGAPVAHEDDAERAVRAGLRILEAIEDLNTREPDLALQVRVGVETGEAVVALDARPELGEGLVTGDVVNTASRLQAAAPAGGLVVGPQTFRATTGLFDTEAMPPAALKGKSQPVPVWQVRRARSRLGVGVIRDHTIPLVGRQLELVLLTGLFDRAVRDGSVQLVTLVGEPGAGKSRLVAELRRVIDDRSQLVRWREGTCLPYGDGITFWALGEIVKAHAGILGSDDAGQAEAKLADAVPAGVPDRDWLIARLRPLVGLDPGSGAGRDEAFVAWQRFCELLATDGPAVLVFEDLHWADEALLAFLEHLVKRSAGLPSLILCTARPELYERYPTWAAGQRNATTINLAPLSDMETAELVTALLHASELDAKVRDLVVERAGGNPLYAEQFVRSLRSDGLIVQTSDGPTLAADAPRRLPHSVHALVSAQLDTLPPERKLLLQDAAVLGRVFWSGALAAMGDREESVVSEHLHALTRKELIRSSRDSSISDEHEYAFWHALVRDVCYGQIPRSARAGKHRRAARWLEQRAAGRVEDVADLLAHHYTQALALDVAAGGTPDAATRDQARRFLLLAGDRAMALDVVRAEKAYAHALQLTPDQHPEYPAMLARHARALRDSGRLAEAEAAYQMAADGYRAAGNLADAGAVLAALAGLLYYRGDSRHVQTAELACTILEGQPAGAALIAAYTQMGIARYIQNDRHGAEQWANRAIELAERLGAAVPGHALGLRGLLRIDRGDAGGRDDLREAVDHSEAGGDFDRAARLRLNLTLVQWLYDGPREALADLRAAAAACERRGLTDALLILQANEIDLLAARGEWSAALELSGWLRHRLETSGSELILLAVMASELRVLARQGHPREVTLPVADRLVTAARESGENQVILLLFTAAALARLYGADLPGTHELLAELVALPELSKEVQLPMELPDLLRAAAACHDLSLAGRLAGLIEPRTPMHAHVKTAATALLADARGDRQAAAEGYAAAAQRWEHFGDVWEYTNALLGQARATSDRTAARALLNRARPILVELGATPLLREADGLLADSEP